ncbi:type IV pilus modification protein PilV [Pontibacterium sp.]|uniref:type IV pilus modification protein PilV n=1 Tax=Pontibacterium sp. TaxID=2036026 RepID=UPI00351598D6
MARRPVAKSAGYTLIEVLVALLVISLGLLGMAALQVSALKQNQNAYARSQVLTAAHGIADRMRANEAGLSAGNYFGTSDAYNGDDPDTSCEDSVCTAAQMATYDLNNWKFYLQENVVGGGGCVTREAENRAGFQVDTTNDLSALCTQSTTAADPVTIYVWWNDERYDNATESAAEGKDLQVITLTMDL